MQLVHTIVCVYCSAKEFMPVGKGQKSARRMDGVCSDCVDKLAADLEDPQMEWSDAAKKDESKTEPKGVSARSARKA